MRTFFALLLLFSCTIIPEDALDYLPTTGRISHMRFNDTRDYSSNPIATAGISYFGKFDQPTKIEVTWGGSMKLMQLPVFDATNRITKTIYELEGGKVSRISNLNSENKEARVETFAYNSSGRLVNHSLRNNYGGSMAYEFANELYYVNGKIDSVYQTVCFNDRPCQTGFMVALTQHRTNSSSTGISDCSLNRSLTANYFSILPYDNSKPFTFWDAIGSHWDATNERYFISPNDLNKAHHLIEGWDEDSYIYNSALSSIKQYEVNSVSQQVESCQNHDYYLSIEYDEANHAPGNFDQAHLNINMNSPVLYFTPVYYFALPDLVPDFEVLMALTCRTDYALYREHQGELDGSKLNEAVLVDIEYFFEAY